MKLVLSLFTPAIWVHCGNWLLFTPATRLYSFNRLLLFYSHIRQTRGTDIYNLTPAKSARQGNLRQCRCLILISHFYQLFLVSCLFDSYVLLADDHVNNVSYFTFMSIKKVFCVLREGYYVIIWLIVRICVFIKDWKLIYSELFILKRKSMDNWGGAVDINCTACICR